MKETRPTLKAAFSTFCFFLILGFLTINFQNCSGLSSADIGSGDGTVSQGENGIIPIGDGTVTNPPTTGTPAESESLTASFSRGDAFSGQNLISQGSFLDSLIDAIQYESYSTGKAIAVAENGMGYAALTASSNSEAERMAMETCNILSGKSCALIVSGNSFVVNSTSAFSSVDYRIDGYSGRPFNGNDIPMAATRVRSSSLVTNYANASGFKAMSISPTGGVYSVFTTNDSLTQSEARRMVLQRCELEAAIVPCIIYAEGNQVVFNPKSWNKISSINFSNNNVSVLSPPASRDAALPAIQNLLTAVGREKYAIYITPSGYGYFGRHATDIVLASSQASALCEAGIDGARCIPYATSSGVILSPDNLSAKANYSAFYCKTVRQSCAVHIAMGCPTGTRYWVQNSSTLEAELATCN